MNLVDSQSGAPDTANMRRAPASIAKVAWRRDRRRKAVGVAVGVGVVVAVGVGVVVVLTAGMAPQSGAAAAASGATAPQGSSASYAVAAQRQPLTTNSRSVVAHDTEVEALVPHSGRLFVATGQWEYPGASASGQVLVKKSKTSPWAVFEKTQSLRVQALDSFPIPSDQGLRSGHSLLVTQAVVAGRSRIQWLLDGANSFSLRDSYVLPARRRRPGVRGARGGRRLVRLCRRPADGGPSGRVVTSAPHVGLQPQPRAHGGSARIAGRGDAEGHRLRRVRWSSLHHHQHDLVPTERRRVACRHPSLGSGLPRATGGAAQQRAPRNHLRQP